MSELWLVTYTETRTRTFWVRGTQESAREDAEELCNGVRSGEWDHIESDLDVTMERRIRRSPQPGDSIWTGGADGEFEEVPSG